MSLLKILINNSQPWLETVFEPFYLITARTFFKSNKFCQILPVTAVKTCTTLTFSCKSSWYNFDFIIPSIIAGCTGPEAANHDVPSPKSSEICYDQDMVSMKTSFLKRARIAFLSDKFWLQLAFGEGVSPYLLNLHGECLNSIFSTDKNWCDCWWNFQFGQNAFIYYQELDNAVILGSSKGEWMRRGW